MLASCSVICSALLQAAEHLTIIGAHHMVGTSLWQAYVSKINCSSTTFELNVVEDMQLERLLQQNPNSFVHAVRDPLDMILSAFRFHSRGGEKWRQALVPSNNLSALQWADDMRTWPAEAAEGIKQAVPLHKYLAHVSRDEGLIHTAYAMIGGPLFLMDETARFLNTSAAAKMKRLTVRHEEMTFSFIATVRKMLLFHGGFARDGHALEPCMNQDSSLAALGRVHDGTSYMPLNERRSLRDVIATTYPLCSLVRHSQLLHGYPPLRCAVKRMGNRNSVTVRTSTWF